MSRPDEALRHALRIAAVSVVLIVLGVAVTLSAPLLPHAASREALVSDRAFLVLLVLAIPIFVLVEVTVVYSALRFRAGAAVEDGPPIASHRRLEVVWVAATLALVLGLAAFGWAGMEEMHGNVDAHAALRVRVVGVQFGWAFEYPDLGISSTELRLPKDRLVHFEITSKDVLHSFWVPSFRVKQDAVPGRMTAVSVTPTTVGRYEATCAELCGIGHTIMHAPVEVMEPAAFDAWVAQRKAAKLP